MDCGGANNTAIIYAIHEKATRFQGGGDTRDNDGSGNGLGVSEDGVEYTLTAADRHGVAYSVDCRNMCLNEELSGTLQAKENGGQSLNYQAPVVYSLVGYAEYATKNPLLRESGGDQGGGSEALAVFSRQRSDELVENAVVSCQSARQYKDNTDLVVARANPPRKYIVRRLTPTECARLQGFPDNWGDVTVKGKPHSDSAEYKLWGNGIALPCAVFVLGRIARIDEQR
jgi:DNA (cytosine-5)-methyltransferase 1